MPKSNEVAVLQDWRMGVDKTLERIESKIDDLDKKFAAKWVQTVVGALIAAILLGFIGVVVYFFIPYKNQTATSTNPSTSTTTTTTTPTGSNSTTRNSGTTGTNTPGATANANSKSDTATPSSQESASSPNGGVNVTLPKVP